MKWMWLRSLRRAPAFAGTVVATLALGIASASVMFSIVYGVLLSPLPYGEPAEVVHVALDTPTLAGIKVAPALYTVYQRHSTRLDNLALYKEGNANVAVPDGSSPAERVAATWVSASAIPLLRVRPVLGSPFTAEDEKRGGRSAVILSESEWRNRYGGAADVIGKTLLVNDVRRTIIGVMPARFSFPTAESRLWLPVRMPKGTKVADASYSLIARLKPGVSTGQVQQELAGILPRLADEFPSLSNGTSTRDWLVKQRPVPRVNLLKEELTRPIRSALWLLASAAVLVVLVAFANGANLMLIRADDKQHELAVHEVLGAGRRRLTVYFLREAALLALLAGLIGGLLGWIVLNALLASGLLVVPRLEAVHVGMPTAAFVLALSAIAACVCGVAPALRFWRPAAPAALRVGARGGTVSRANQRVRAAIAAFQIAVALATAAGSLALARTAARLYDVDPGFATSGVTTLWTQLPFKRYKEVRAVEFYERLAARARALPGVEAAGVASRLPLGDGELVEQNVRSDVGEQAIPMQLDVVGGAYFDALRIPMLAGRPFASSGADPRPDVILSRSAATALFGKYDNSVVGRHVSFDSSPVRYTVVGLVGDVRAADLASLPGPLVYRPQAVAGDSKTELPARRSMALVIRSKASNASVLSDLKRVVHDLDPRVPTFGENTMDEIVGRSSSKIRLALLLLTAAASVTLALGAVGLYGLMAYLVRLRTREFGIRAALGAEPKEIRRLVLAHGLRIAAVGVMVGLALHTLAMPWLRSVVVGVVGLDPVTVSAAVCVLILSAFVACLMPALRASHTDPMLALQSE